jgi:hypothetical protein
MFKNVINLPIKDAFDEMAVEIYQNSTLDVVEVMAFGEPNYDNIDALITGETDDRLGTQRVVVKSVKELILILEEILAEDYDRLNTQAMENEDEQISN